LFGIVINVARSHVRAHKRTVPLSALVAEEAIDGPTVEPERFFHDGEWVGHWADWPTPFPSPDSALERVRLRALLEVAIGALPPLRPEKSPSRRRRTTAHRKPYVNQQLERSPQAGETLTTGGGGQVHELGSDRHTVWSSYPRRLKARNSSPTATAVP